jgi:hypothetical protein
MNCCELLPARILEDLLEDARKGKELRHSILNMLWGAFFTESWIRAQKNRSSLGQEFREARF